MELSPRISEWVSRRLEAGGPVLPLARPLGRIWDAVATHALVRPLDLRGVACPVVAVGGATLGGSGKTPVALACARELSRAGVSVAIVGHAYRARPGAGARVVTTDDDVVTVGDEALALARDLALAREAGARIHVVVGESRAAAVALGARVADVLVLDGVLQTSPRRADLSLLAVEADAPFGANRPPPAGDRRAPAAELLAACDHAVAVMGGCAALPAFASPASVESRGARLSSHLLTWSDMGSMRLGLFTALARPDRIVRFAEARGVRLRAIVRAADHHGPMDFHRSRAAAAVQRGDVDVWLASSKCAAHLPGELGGAPVAVVDYELQLASETTRLLHALAHRT